MKTPLWIIFATFLYLAACKEETETARPEIRELTEAVYASGNIYPKEEYQVFANADGLLENVMAEAGDTVSSGSILFSIENEIPAIRQRANAAIYQTVQQNNAADSPYLLEAKSQLESAQAKLKNDSIQFIRYQNLLKEKAVAQSVFDAAALAFSVSRNDYQARKNHYQKLKNQLFIELQQAENQYRQSSREKAHYLVKARLNGRVYEVYKERGEAVRRNEPLALLGSTNAFVLRLQVDQQDIAKINKGQEVLVKLDLEKDKIYKAAVSKIYPKLNVQDQAFRVDAAFTGERPVLYHGISAEANILIRKKEKVLAIPKKLLATTDSLWLKTPDGVKKVRIRKGIEDFDYVEVLSGLDEKSEIIIK